MVVDPGRMESPEKACTRLPRIIEELPDRTTWPEVNVRFSPKLTLAEIKVTDPFKLLFPAKVKLPPLKTMPPEPASGPLNAVCAVPPILVNVALAPGLIVKVLFSEWFAVLLEINSMVAFPVNRTLPVPRFSAS